MYDAHFTARPDFDRFHGFPLGIGHIQGEPEHSVGGTTYQPSFYNVHFVVRGTGWIQTEHGTAQLKPGMGFLYGGHPQFFGTNGDDPWEVWWIYFAGEGMSPLLADKALRDVWAFSYGENDRVMALVQELWTTARLNNARQFPKQAALLYELMLELLLHTSDLNTSGERSLSHSIRRAAEYMRMNCSRRLPLQKLADLCEISPAYFSRTFHEEMGIPPLTYLNNQRIELSKQMLMATAKPVKQIALEVGFSQPSYFIERFRIAEGVTPTVFREGAVRKKEG
ncbi:AraC family transcriptional regulator [Paenibacillus sp. OV219]|uniref:helix-turn-helix transcriptional regulator n=1 Tax=Paenibacillus sp. OV219 TaxID=1884377 RepID=UPI0008BE70C8|nr:AraC family transcriptional regulator [Paenibacillus sp. OV219]SEO33080.1 AraC-type DNA-binding protein [Paenibacillus sp. OV219]